MPVVVATMLRKQGVTGVQTHFQQVLKYLALDAATPTMLVTPFSSGWPLYLLIFGLRREFGPVSGRVSLLWYQCHSA